VPPAIHFHAPARPPWTSISRGFSTGLGAVICSIGGGALRNLDRFNYLDNVTYHIDGYGTHIYPNPDSVEQSVTDLIGQDAAILGPDKPFWITEWGLGANRYPNKQEQTRSDGIREFYAILDKLHIPFGPRFYYAYDLLIEQMESCCQRPAPSQPAPLNADRRPGWPLTKA
jgi:hypothetical protein